VGTSSNASVNNTAKVVAKTWTVDSYVVNGVTYTISGTAAYGHAVFTENGTYWTETYNGSGTTTQKDNGQWKWSDATQTKMCTSQTDAVPDCSNTSAISFDTNGNLIMTTGSTSNPSIYYFSPLVP
ncbi:MAG TPA: hypothetical protein VK796_07240, partial [Cytophaga sp.]|nr:hypothetical protein [Cytophaga sp.]